MAKVTGPLMSMSATGKLANAIVYFPWKGLHVVREWLKPANPQSGAQGDQRVIAGALGRGTSVVHTTSDFAAEIRAYMAAGLTWPSAIMKYMVDNVVNDGTAWVALVTEYEAHTATAAFDTEAAALNLQEFDLDYKAMADLAAPGAILYCLAKFATNWELLGTKGFQRSPYTIALASWVEANIQSMVAEFAAA